MAAVEAPGGLEELHAHVFVRSHQALYLLPEAEELAEEEQGPQGQRKKSIVRDAPQGEVPEVHGLPGERQTLPVAEVEQHWEVRGNL